MKLYKIFSLILIAALFGACEDVITVDLEDGDQQLVVDGWINNQMKPQVIRLVRTSSYFDSSPSPAVTGATVTVTDNTGTVFNFTDNSNGDYVWTPTGGLAFGQVGNTYTLSITTEGKEYTSVSTMNRIMEIDSIGAEFREEELGQPEGYYASLFATDPIGPDTYWIKSYKNGRFLSDPGQMNLAVNGGFTVGATVDGIVFIIPIREGINPFGEEDEDGNDIAPFTTGDSIHVEIHSISEDAFFFLNAARTQMTLGDATLFAEPPSNVPTNIVSLNGTEPGDEPVGFFNVSAVAEKGRQF